MMLPSMAPMSSMMEGAAPTQAAAPASSNMAPVQSAPQAAPPAAPPKAAPKQDKPADYTDANIEMWKVMMKNPMAKKTGLDKVFEQRIKDRTDAVMGYAGAIQKGYDVRNISDKGIRTAVVSYLKSQGKDPSSGKGMKPEYVAGLRTLMVSLIGNPDGKSDVEKQGLYNYLDVFDDADARRRIQLIMDMTNPDEKHGAIYNQAAMTVANKMLTDHDRSFITQWRRARSAIQALRPVTGLPRATETLNRIYQQELPDLITVNNSNAAYERLAAIHREIWAALSGQLDAQDLGDFPDPPNQAKPQGGAQGWTPDK